MCIFWISVIALTVSQMVAASERHPMESALDFHNRYRWKHLAIPITTTDHLMHAATFCAQVYLKKGNSSNYFQYHNRKYGMNIMLLNDLKTSDKEILKKATDEWYAESKNYDYAEGKCQEGKVCDHFTQMAWLDSTKMGMGVARNETTTAAVVLYSPRGNLPNAYKKKVFPPDQKEPYF